MLPGGNTAIFPRDNKVGVISARSPDDGKLRFVPVTLDPPDDFPIRFKHRIEFGGEKEAQEPLDMILTVDELARTAYTRPIVLGAEGESLIVALANAGAIYPMVWHLPLRELEARMFGSETQR